MAENVINAIKADFIAQSEGCATDTLESFCAFAKEWLQKKCVVGVGQTTDGFAIRFADGAEFLLTESAALEDMGGAVSIGGMTGRGDRVRVDNSSVGITGR
jgi:hypothetical protein